MATSILTGIYTLTPTHCGSGQAAGAVDLPIAREVHTGFPVLPASGLKGAIRATVDDKKLAQWLFGPELDGAEKDKDKPRSDEESLAAGALVILEGRLLAYPLRSLQRPFLYATCPLILERLARDLRALDLAGLLGPDWHVPRPAAAGGSKRPCVLVSDRELAGKSLVVEDLVYPASDVGELVQAGGLKDLLAGLLPAGEADTRQRLAGSLLVLGDAEFADVIQRAVPVQARIKLNDETKTTSGEGGNLWYEEALPPDCLFLAPATKRVGLHESRNPVQEFARLLGERKTSIQIGGNETVGEGFCWWTAHQGPTSGGPNRG